MSANLPRLSSDFLKVLRDGQKALRAYKKVDPKDRYVLLYPDSENVHVGMGFNLLNTPAEEIYKKASDLLKKDVLRLCLEGPKDKLLDSYENRNIAAFVTSHATVIKLNHEKQKMMHLCSAAGGIGVGFINSLVFCGSMSFEDGLDLVQRQAQAMEKAAQIIPSAKIRVRLCPATRKHKVCRAAIEHCISEGVQPEIAVCSITKQISAHDIEIGGHIEAIKYLENDGQNLFEFRKVRRVVKIPHAYNTDLMQPAKEFLVKYIEQKIQDNQDYLKEPQTSSVYSATAGHRLRTLESIKDDLYIYPVRPIKMEQVLQCIYRRDSKVAHPNTLVIWDKNLLNTLARVNRKAWSSAKLLRA